MPSVGRHAAASTYTRRFASRAIYFESVDIKNSHVKNAAENEYISRDGRRRQMPPRY